MVPTLFLIALAGTAVDVGWKPTPDGRIEYIIQVTPEEVQNLNIGDIIAASDVPPGLPPIAAYRIVVGRGPLPRELPDHPSTTEPRETIASDPRQDNDPSKVTRVAQPAVGVFPADAEQLPAIPTEAGPTSGSSQPSDTAKAEDVSPVDTATSNAAENAPDRPQPENLSNDSSSQSHVLPVVAAILFALCLASVALAAWIATDYRRKYRELVKNVDSSLLPPNDSQESPAPSEDTNTPKVQQSPS
ncbi:MAG: hypothetical protein WBH86_03160 [Thermogutta sp.]